MFQIVRLGTHIISSLSGTQALGGHNVNCITLYWGHGGVHTSRYTSHLEEMYGSDNHCMFDPHVFFSDDELRKEIPTWQVVSSTPARKSRQTPVAGCGRTS